MVRRFVVLSLFALVTLAVPALTEDFSSPNGAPKWKVYEYNRSGQEFRARIPSALPDGIVFDFLPTPDNALLGTSHPSYRGNLLGNRSGKTITARLAATLSSGAQFQYYGQGTPSNPCGTPASVRFYFETGTPGQFAYTNYWWSNPISIRLDALAAGGPVTLTVEINPALWSDWNGQSGTTESAGFAAAAKDIQFIGLSFGGGCFFENGVGVTNGSGTFKLISFSVN